MTDQGAIAAEQVFGTTADGGAAAQLTAQQRKAGRSPWRLTVIALLLAMLLGAVGGGWLMMRWFAPQPSPALVQRPTTNATPANVAPRGLPAGVVATPAAPLAAAPAPTLAQTAELSARVAMLEERLARITMAADSASGNVARAEAILVAFAARRAIDRGVGLGSMEAQLRLRFGDTQPNAIESILSAAADPITREELAARLQGIRSVALADSDSGWLTRMGNSLSSLIKIRRADAPSLEPVQRFDRATRALSIGQLDQAIVEVETLPGHSNAAVQYWLRDARRYHNAHRALDIIETAALVEPAQNRVGVGESAR
ncbi:MAG: MICOS complex subunit MIC60 [Sphingopyxis sp.]|nr:MICOS complex subunit MIC60 [Sphingopyxis sp.]